MNKRLVSGQQLEILQFVSENAPVSVREVAERYGESRGLARTTVLTVMERLRRQGYLTRERSGEAYRYSPAGGRAELMIGMVRDFVDTALSGALGPLVAYLAQARNLTPEQIAELQKLANDLKPDGEAKE